MDQVGKYGTENHSERPMIFSGRCWFHIKQRLSVVPAGMSCQESLTERLKLEDNGTASSRVFMAKREEEWAPPLFHSSSNIPGIGIAG